MENAFNNIASAEIAKVNASADSNIAELKELKTVEEILSKWYFKNTMTDAARAKKWEVSTLIEYITQRINKATAKKIEEMQSRLSTVAVATRVIDTISISVEWAKNRTWGNCPQAEIRICFTDQSCDRYQSGRITGCGYDKESTAVAQALNQSNELLRAMYSKKETASQKDNREIFGYGSGYGVRPYFEGGVGVSCYPAIFDTLGYTWKHISNGKTFDVYQVEPKAK